MNANERETKIPTIRANSNDINRLFGLFAAQDTIAKAQTELARQIKVIPNGLRDIRMIGSVLNKLLEKLLMTMPVEKLQSIRRMAPHMTYCTKFGAQASKIDDGECLIPNRDVDILTKFAFEQCKLCVDCNCDRCELGKTFDRLLTVDRDGRCWAFMTLTEGEDCAHK